MSFAFDFTDDILNATGGIANQNNSAIIEQVCQISPTKSEDFFLQSQAACTVAEDAFLTPWSKGEADPHNVSVVEGDREFYFNSEYGAGASSATLPPMVPAACDSPAHCNLQIYSIPTVSEKEAVGGDFLVKTESLEEIQEPVNVLTTQSITEIIPKADCGTTVPTSSETPVKMAKTHSSLKVSVGEECARTERVNAAATPNARLNSSSDSSPAAWNSESWSPSASVSPVSSALHSTLRDVSNVSRAAHKALGSTEASAKEKGLCGFDDASFSVQANAILQSTQKQSERMNQLQAEYCLHVADMLKIMGPISFCKPQDECDSESQMMNNALMRLSPQLRGSSAIYVVPALEKLLQEKLSMAVSE